MPERVIIRPLAAREECEDCVALQREVWGRDFVDVVPASLLQVAPEVGGVASGAFAASGRLLGFVFGISGVRDGKAAHWSDMLAVRPEARRQGLARRLKVHQREQLLALGIERVYWTFDPLVARNAHLNLSTLGATAIRYVPNMYGQTGSVLHRGLNTDRLVVEWRLADARVGRAIDGDPGGPPDAGVKAPVVSGPQVETMAEASLPAAPWVRVELPPDVDHLKQVDLDLARRWQQGLRRALTHYLRDGAGHVAGVYPEPHSGRWFYLVRTSRDDT